MTKSKSARERRLANLGPFAPGQSGNPGGRPKRRLITYRYEQIVEAPLLDRDRRKLRLAKGATYGDAIALAVAQSAIAGDMPAAREMREAIEGKATQRVELTETDIRVEAKIASGDLIAAIREIYGLGPRPPVDDRGRTPVDVEQV